jgi:hypothetical protein
MPAYSNGVGSAFHARAVASNHSINSDDLAGVSPARAWLTCPGCSRAIGRVPPWRTTSAIASLLQPRCVATAGYSVVGQPAYVAATLCGGRTPGPAPGREIRFVCAGCTFPTSTIQRCKGRRTGAHFQARGENPILAPRVARTGGTTASFEMTKVHDGPLSKHHAHWRSVRSTQQLMPTRAEGRRFRPTAGAGWGAALLEIEHQAEHWDDPAHGEIGHLIAEALRTAVAIARKGGLRCDHRLERGLSSSSEDQAFGSDERISTAGRQDATALPSTRAS